jgi:hypothetical protein
MVLQLPALGTRPYVVFDLGDVGVDWGILYYEVS